MADDPLDSWLKRVEDYIRKHGATELADLGQPHAGLSRPAGIRSIKAALQARPQRFALEVNSRNGCVVHLSASQYNHKFTDGNMHDAFLALLRLNRAFRRSAWPTRRDQVDVSGQVLYAMSRGGYVKVTGGTTLKWSQPRIQDAITKMPDYIVAAATPANAPSPPPQQEQQATHAPAQQTSAPEPEHAPAQQTSAPEPEGEAFKAMQRNVLGDYSLILVDNEEALLTAQAHCADVIASAPATVAVDCEGVPDGLDLVQVAIRADAGPTVLVFDCVKLTPHRVCECLRDILISPAVTVLFHDVHKDAYALAIHGGVPVLHGVVDTQLVAEFAWGDVFVGFNKLMQKSGSSTHPTKYAMKATMGQSLSYWKKRPLRPTDVEYAALDATLLLEALPKLMDLVGDAWLPIMAASRERAAAAIESDGARSIGFDMASDYALASTELLRHVRPADLFVCTPLLAETDNETVVNLLPRDMRQKLKTAEGKPFFGLFGGTGTSDVATPSTVEMDRLSDVVLDVGRRPLCWVDGSRVFLCDREQRLVNRDDVDYVTRQVGAFGTDRRAGMDRKLHRISAMFNRDERIAGLTMRLGRSVRGNADMIVDLLLGSSKSILVLGEPGAGKTTIIRECTRILAERHNTVVVDTSNEIAGDGLIPHACIGLARRMMVPSLDQQSAVMIECVQNHTPHVMVIDEIGRPKEVNAARTVKQRGVRMIASAHGDLRRLLKNAELQGLVGGVTSVLLGDAMAKEEARRKGGEVHKMKAQRGGEPTFDMIIEVRRGALHEWRVTTDVAHAVDKILEGEEYKVQMRTRDPETGSICLELTRA